jgi:protoheme IX farnesyltransferase
MSASTLICDRARTTPLARLADYIELTKPRIAALELVTVAAAAFFAAGGPIAPGLLFWTLLGTALVAASASALNQWLERHTDSLMDRTANRPLPAGRLSPREVFFFGVSGVLAGVLLLGIAVNWPTAAFGLLTWLLYVAFYTPLKIKTPANTMVGALADAMPVLMGWTCVEKPLDLDAAILFMVLFLWQFPHFMAIAWIYRRDYAAAGMKMLTVADPTGRRAGAQAVLAALMLVPISLLPAVRLIEPTYFALVLVLGAIQLAAAILFMLRLNENSARRLLRMTLIYLPAVLVLLMLTPVI